MLFLSKVDMATGVIVAIVLHGEGMDMKWADGQRDAVRQYRKTATLRIRFPGFHLFSLAFSNAFSSFPWLSPAFPFFPMLFPSVLQFSFACTGVFPGFPQG